MTESRLTSSDYFALFLIAITLVNINGLTTLLTNNRGLIEQTSTTLTIYGVFALPISLYLIASCARISSMGDIFWLFVLFWGLFLFGSLVPLLVAGELNPELMIELPKSYIGVIICVLAVYFWAGTISDAKLANVLRISKGLLLITSLLTIFSEQFHFYEIYGDERAGGILLNPNEAAAAALYCFVLVVAFPARSRLLNLAQGSIALGALILTFSRTGLLIFMLLALLLFFHKPSIKMAVLFLMGMILVSLGLWSIFEYDLFNLTTYQRQQLRDVIDLLTGQANERTVGPRGILFDAGMQKIAEVFPWGAGLDKFHAMEGIIRSPTPGAGGKWQGVHNTYLMVIGEAGLPAFMAFLAFWARTIWKLTDSPFRVFGMGAAVIFLFDMTTSHNILLQRLPTLMLAFVMVVAARSPRSRKTSLAPETVLGSSQP